MSSQRHSISFVLSSETEIVPTFSRALSRLEKSINKNLSTGQFYHDLLTAFTEGAANAIRHAKELEKKGRLKGRLAAGRDAIRIEIEDHGPGFNPEKISLPRFDHLAESGRGLFMMRQLVDSVEYKKSKKGKNPNRLVLKRFFPASDDENAALDLLYEMSDAFSATLDRERIYNIILEAALQVFRVERASILIFDKEAKKLKVAASRGLKPLMASQISVAPGEGIAGYVFSHAKPCLIQDIRKNKAGWSEKKQYKSRSFISAPMICSPMRLGQESIGVINMTDRLDGRPFTRRDLKLLTTITNQASAYLYMMRLASEARQIEAYRRELVLAEEIQKNYLPRSSPQVFGLDLAGWCQPAQSVGGDYFDFIQKDEQNFYVVIADVSGHNIAAALTMANFRTHLRTLLLAEEDPGKILTLLNKNLYDDLARGDQFISMVLLRFQTEDGVLKNKVKMVNAGHRFPLLIKNRPRVVEVIKEGQTVLGVTPNQGFETFSMELEGEEWIFLYTDGLTELTLKEGGRFGQEKLIQWLKQNCEKGAIDLMTRLKERIKEWRGSLVDDATAVAIRRI